MCISLWLCVCVRVCVFLGTHMWADVFLSKTLYFILDKGQPFGMCLATSTRFYLIGGSGCQLHLIGCPIMSNGVLCLYKTCPLKTKWKLDNNMNVTLIFHVSKVASLQPVCVSVCVRDAPNWAILIMSWRFFFNLISFLLAGGWAKLCGSEKQMTITGAGQESLLVDLRRQ